MSGELQDDVKKIANAGYDGVEAPISHIQNREKLLKLLEFYNLEFIALITTRNNHEASFEEQLHEAMKFDPFQIVSHSAKDCMTFDEKLRFFHKAVALEKLEGIPIGHETHRGRAMFTPWMTADLLRQIKDLKITADLGHWCCACESLLENQTDNLSVVFERTIHIHGRVGYNEGPQVPDPRAPEYIKELETHENWWMEIYKERKKKKFDYITFNPEYGGMKPRYMHSLPYTDQPVADSWDICFWTAQRFKNQVADKEKNGDSYE